MSVSTLVRRNTGKRWLNQFCRAVLCLPSGQTSCFDPWLICLRTLPLGVHTHLSTRRDLDTKASGRSKTLYGLALSPDFWPPRSFLPMCGVSLAPKSGKIS